MSPGKTFLASLLMFLFLRFCNSTDTITLTRHVNDGDILVSSGESFALGFFSPTNSSNRYVGIWYNKIPEPTIVWVANRDNPISNSSGVLSVDETGNIILHERGQTIAYWSSNNSAVVNGDFSAQLLDTGNLLFQGQNRQVFLWQSFDHPTNTFLPEMKFGLDRKTGLNRFFTSWKSSENPGIGEFSYKMEFVGSTQLFLYKGKTRVWRTGSWTGRGWSGVPQMKRTFMIFDISFIDNNDEVVIIDHVPNSSTFSRLVMNESGIVERLTWQETNRRWNVYLSAPIERCDRYSNCGPFGYCDHNEPNKIDCKCFPGYEPRSPQDWEQWDGSEGCTTKLTTRMCEDGDDFIELPFSKVPDTSAARVDMRIGLKACKELCLKNCSCMGYANADISGEGRGCITWYGELIDTRTFPSWGQSFYVRVDAAEFAKNSLKNQKPSHTNRFLVIGVPMIAVGFLISTCICYYIKKKRTNREHEAEFILKSSTAFQGSFLEKDIRENVDIHVFDLSTIVAATDNFSPSNKLGEGGFGSVYKGKLLNGNEIAVKRLSQSSGQGMEEFKNEVTLIAKLQHRNLVRLLGYCFQKEEQMLIYEYLPNKGLDSFIFDQEKGSILDWKKRFQIILGIVRGLLYLHQDSRLKIIHRDLKASNVLLDAALNPKISDFGMAKIFGGDQDQAKTRRVVGTYGYMSPEYAMEGLFSVKSDVYSFGVLVLEIISGRKNTSYYMEMSLNLIGHVWDLWKQDRALSVVDSSLGNEYDTREVLLCIHVGILCLQESANDRPTMTDVASMLRNHETKLSSPNQPAFIFRQSSYATDRTLASASAGVRSVDDDTITIVQAR